MNEEAKRPVSKSGQLQFGIILPVIRAAGLIPWTIAFVILIFVAGAIVAMVEPGVASYGDGLWLMFQVATTIGLGDFTCVSFVGRMAAVIVSFYSVFFIALVTGAVVSFCAESMNARRDASVAEFIYKLEHLPELSHEELVDLSEKVKKNDSRWK